MGHEHEASAGRSLADALGHVSIPLLDAVQRLVARVAMGFYLLAPPCTTAPICMREFLVTRAVAVFSHHGVLIYGLALKVAQRRSQGVLWLS